MPRPSFRNLLQRLSWRGVLPWLAIGCFFWAVYGGIGWQLKAHGTVRFNDLLFNSDTYRILGDMCDFGRIHKRSNVHPLFVLFLNPAGSLLTRLFGSQFTAAVLFNSFIGAAAITLAASFWRRAGVPWRRTLLLTLLLGFSSAHLFFGSSPETFSLSALTIILLFHAALRAPGKMAAFVPAGLFSFGTLLTNLAFVSLSFFSSDIERSALAGQAALSRPLLRAFGRTVLLVYLVVYLAAGLAWAQKRIWPSTRPFYLVQTYRAEERFMDKPQTAADVVSRETLLLRHVFAYDWFAPRLEAYEGRRYRFQSGSLATIPLPGEIALAGWFVLLLASGWLFFRRQLYRQAVPLGLSLCLLFNLFLHTLYGDDLFLYACNTCFLVLSLVALAWRAGELSAPQNRWLDAGLAALLLLELANNQQFIATICTVPL